MAQPCRVLVEVYEPVCCRGHQAELLRGQVKVARVLRVNAGLPGCLLLSVACRQTPKVCEQWNDEERFSSFPAMLFLLPTYAAYIGGWSSSSHGFAVSTIQKEEAASLLHRRIVWHASSLRPGFQVELLGSGHRVHPNLPSSDLRSWTYRSISTLQNFEAGG